MFKRFCMVLVVFHHLLTLGHLVSLRFEVLAILSASLGALIVICALQFIITGQWHPYASFKGNR